MRRLWMVLAALLLIAATAWADQDIYRYGGSGYDYLGDIDTSKDGRILMTGHTESTDGTLSDRTKTGRTGWALCVDAQGEVLFSFCSRNDEEAWMDCPVFHEDGSATVLLYSGMGAGGVEMIRLSPQGEDIWRKEIIPEGAGGAFYADATPLGYIFSCMDGKGRPSGMMLFDWEGEKIREYDDLFEYFDGRLRGGFLLGGTHEERKILRMNDGGEYETFAALQADSEITTSAELRATEDGGVFMFMGLQPEDGADSRVLRWDAQGELVYDMNIVDGEISDARGANGGVVLLRGAADGWEGVEVTRLDGEGIIARSNFISADDGYFTYGYLAMLPDGRAAVLGQSTEPGRESDPVLAIAEL